MFGADEQRKRSASRLQQKRSPLLRRFVGRRAPSSANSHRAKRDVLAVKLKSDKGSLRRGLRRSTGELLEPLRAEVPLKAEN